jgi:hypothetical protein
VHGFGITFYVLAALALAGAIVAALLVESQPAAPEEPVVEPVGDLGRGQRAQPRRRQLDRERQPVEPPADLDDGAHVLVGHREARAHGGRAVGEQLHRRERQRLRRRGVRRGQAQRGDRGEHLTHDRERLAGRGEHA